MVSRDLKELRKKCRHFLLTLLSESMQISKVYLGVRAEFPQLCNDRILCSCGEVIRTDPEWHHQVRWALQDLKFKGLVRYDNLTRRWSRAR